MIRVLAALVLVAGVAAGCGGDDRGDLTAFCAAMDDLRAADPFADLAVASPEDMRDAFGELADSAKRVADAAPPDARVQADRYAAAIEALRGELAGAGYDPTRLDSLRYRQATDEYTAAAVSLDNAGTSACS